MRSRRHSGPKAKNLCQKTSHKDAKKRQAAKKVSSIRINSFLFVLIRAIR